MEFIPGLKLFYYLIPLLITLNIILWEGGILNSFLDIVLVLSALIMGSIVTPVFLPWIPGRSLAFKGWIMGIFPALIYSMFFTELFLSQLFYLALLPPISSYIALNFTGSTTYTSLSGVLKEMKYGLPVMICSVLCGVGLRIYAIFS